MKKVIDNFIYDERYSDVYLFDENGRLLGVEKSYKTLHPKLTIEKINKRFGKKYVHKKYASVK